MVLLRIVLLLLPLGLQPLLLSQDPRGTFAGLVADATGAVVPGVSVRFLNVETRVALTVSTNSQGVFESLYMLPGTYDVTVEHPGFKSWRQTGAPLRTGERVRLDIALEVGGASERVEVTAQAPLVESTTGSISQVITSQQVAELPLRGGSVAWVYSMAPGVALTNLPFDGPWNVSQAAYQSVAGSGADGVDFNLDGVSNNATSGWPSFVPPADMVQEVRVNVTGYDAAQGHSSGGSINVTLKSGTNALHGTVGFSGSSGPMMTRNFFTNNFIFNPATGPITPAKIKDNTPSMVWNRFTGAAGGPLVIPGLYNGRGRTFWMLGYQQHNRKRPLNYVFTVPTEAQKRGDFSALLALGPQYQIYDPFTTQPSGASRFARQPVPGNVIPASRIAATALNITKHYPAANAAGTIDGSNNYWVNRADIQNLYQGIVRVDQNFSERHRMFGRYSHSDFAAEFDQYIPNSNVRGRARTRPHRGAALDSVWVLSPRSVLDVRYGFEWFQDKQTYYNLGWDLTEFGFPASLLSQIDPALASFPLVNVAGLLQLGNDSGVKPTTYSHSLLTVYNYNYGKHSLHAGADLRLIYDTNFAYGNISPALTFGSTYTLGPLDNSAAAPAGQGLASLLFGIPTGGGVDANDSRAESSRFWAFYLQDDWRVSRKLTLNLGLRWEYEGPITERFNRTSRDFDFAAVNPIEEQARAQYARAPIPEIPAAQFRTLGGLTFAGVGGIPRGVRNPDYRVLMPRFGLAYEVSPRLVLRGGYGIFFGLLGSEFSDVSQPGFSQRTNIVPSLDNGVTYVASISNPLPTGVQRPLGAAGGLTTFLGSNPGFFSEDGRRPYTQRWSASVQYQPLSQSVLELGYIGSRSVRLRVSADMNSVPRQYLSTSPVRDQAVIDNLSARASNPFVGIAGFAGNTLYSAANTTKGQLLRPYPHFMALSAALPAGSSWYHAFTARFERRMKSGLQVQGNYTWSKNMGASNYLNPTDTAPEHSISAIDRPHKVNAMGMYELPFGPGRPLLSSARGWFGHLVGGWQTQLSYVWQMGGPMGFGNVLFTGDFNAIALSSSERSLQRWFNTAGFERNTQRQLSNNIRTFPSRLAGVRTDGIRVIDAAIHKTFRIREGLRLQLRGDAEGVANQTNFAAPNTDPVSTAFGSVTATQTQQEERRIFVGLKLIF